MFKRHMAGLLLAVVLTAPAAADATTYYVSPAGSNGNTGTSNATPFATIQYAAGMTQPGDRVLIMDGTYDNNAPGDNVLLISRSGTASAPIVYAAMPGQHPVLQGSQTWAVVRVSADYVELDGLEIEGDAARMSIIYALLHARDLDDPSMNGDGIDVVPADDGTVAHHVTVRDMLIHDVPGGGIAVDGSDYVTLQDNVISNTSNWSPYGDSGISLYQSRDIDENKGVKNLIEGNVVFDNMEYVACVCQDYQSVSDGNGIIVDDNLNAEGDGLAYGGRTVVAFNVSYGNGGSGMHAFSSQHVDLVGNTAYDNDLSGSLDLGEIYAEAGSDVNIVDNILVAPAGKAILSDDGNTAVVEDYNVLFDIGGAVLTPSTYGSHDILADPLLSGPGDGDFSLSAGSPALGSAEPAALLDASVPGAAILPVLVNRGAE